MSDLSTPAKKMLIAVAICLLSMATAEAQTPGGEAALLAISEIDGTVRLAEINQQTGDITSLVDSGFALADLTQGIGALDSNSGRFFYHRSISGGTTAIVTISLNGGATDVPTSERISLIEYDHLGDRLLGIADIDGTIRLVEVDPETGEVTPLVDSGFALSGLTQGVEAFDVNSGRFFYSKGTTGGFADIVTISLDGQVSSAPASERFFLMEYDPIANRLLVIADIGGTIHLAEIDPKTGDVTSLADSGSNLGLTQGIEAFDPVAGKFFFRSGGPAAAAEITAISLDGVLAVVTTPGSVYHLGILLSGTIRLKCFDAIESRTIRDVDDNGTPDLIQVPAIGDEVDERLQPDARRVAIAFPLPAGITVFAAAVKLTSRNWPNDSVTWHLAPDNGTIDINDWYISNGSVASGTRPGNRPLNAMEFVFVTGALQAIGSTSAHLRFGLRMTNMQVGHAVYNSYISDSPPELCILFRESYIFRDDFESGDATAWPVSVGPPN